MKKILAVLLLLALASICSAQVEHGGLTIPGEGAVQVVRKAAAAPVFPTDGLELLFYADSYQNNTGSTAVWPDESGKGRNATQTTEVYKMTASVVDGISLLSSANVSGNMTISATGYVLPSAANCTIIIAMHKSTDAGGNKTGFRDNATDIRLSFTTGDTSDFTHMPGGTSGGAWKNKEKLVCGWVHSGLVGLSGTCKAYQNYSLINTEAGYVATGKGEFPIYLITGTAGLNMNNIAGYALWSRALSEDEYFTAVRFMRQRMKME